MTNKRVQISENTDGNMELRVSRPGFDVDIATHAEEIAFSSEWDLTIPIHASGVISGFGSASFPALPYIPFAFFYRKDGNKLRRDEMSRVKSSYGVRIGVLSRYAMRVNSSSIEIFQPVSHFDATYWNGSSYYEDIPLTSPEFAYVILKQKAFDIR